MRTLPIGVIGVGVMGRNHVRNLSREARFELVGVYDVNAPQAAWAAEEYGTRAYGDVDRLLDEVEAVVVAVPSSLHRAVGLRAASHHVHALIEKPLATNSADARELAAAFAARGLKLAAGHIERFNPVTLELDKLLDERRVICIEIHRCSPLGASDRITDVSVIEDLMIHDVELACHLMAPAAVREIHGMGTRVHTDRTDFASCTLRFDGGAYAVLHASRVSQEKERTLCVHAEDCCIRADLLNKTLTISRNTDSVMVSPHANAYRQSGVVERVFVPPEEPLRLELLSFYDSVVVGAPVVVDGPAGIQAISICEEVARQTRERDGAA